MTTGASHLPHHEGRNSALRALAEAASENASIIAADGTFIEVSSNVAAMALAHGLNDLRGHSLFEFMGPEDEAIERNLRDILRDGKPGKFEYITADRHRRLTYRFEIRVAPLPNQPVSAPLFAVFAHDLTPRGTVEQQRAVTEFGQYALLAAKDDELLSQAVKVTAGTLRVDYCAILELMPGRSAMRMRAAVGWSVGSQPPIRVEGSPCGFALRSRAPVIVNDYSREQRFTTLPHIVDVGIQSGITVAIGGRDDPFGVLVAYSTEKRAFVTNDIAFTQSIANIVSLSLERLAGDAALRRSEEYYRSLIENSSDSVSVIAPDGTVLFNSRSADTTFGHDPGAVIGVFGLSAIHPDDRELATNALATTLDKGRVALECRIRRREGTWLHCDVRGRRILDAEGRPAAVFNTHDISERKAAEKAFLETQAQLRPRLEQQRAVAELSQHAIQATQLYPLLEEAAAVIANTLHVEFSGLGELPHGGKAIRMGAAIGWPNGTQLHAITDLHAAYSLSSTGPVIVEDFSTEARVGRLPLALESGILSGIAMLVGGSSRPWGALGAYSLKPRKFTEEDAAFLQAVANIIAQAVERLTSLQALRRSEEYFRTMIHSSSDVIVVMKPDGTVTFANKAADIFGRPNQRYIGTTGMEFVHPDDHEEVKRGLAEATDKGASQYELRVLGESGEWRHCEARAMLTSDPEGAPVIVASSRDITERKHLERELLTTRDAALEAARLKSEFMANISHEIRTPLNAIVGMTGLLRETTLSDDQREMLESVRTSSDALLSLVNDVLDFSKLSAGKLQFENIDFDLHEAVEAALEMFSPAARLKEIELAVHIGAGIPSTLNGDPGRLRQVLHNLIGNAVKFTERGSVCVNVHLAHEDESGVGLGFEVRDTGIGILPQALSRLFEPFSQADASVTRKYGGSGLGLAIAANLVSRMGGTIGVTSEPGAGSTFLFMVKLKRAAAPACITLPWTPLAQEHIDAPARKLRVLVAEDNIINQKVALRQLARLGYHADGVANGCEALQAIDRVPYDLILMDCQMPEMDGYQATAEIRQAERCAPGRHVVIIAMTANAMEGDREKCLAAGMDDYLAKPITLDKLSQALSRAVARD